MTINEVEQGIRNLIATQPMIIQGAMGEVINGLLALIDSTKNLAYRVQTYPVQDALKFNMSNEVQRVENALTNLVCQSLQSRGINILLYIPQNQQQYNPMQNQYGVMGQMMYTQNPVQMSNTPTMMQMPNAMPQMQGQVGANPMFGMNPSMQGVASNNQRGMRRPNPQPFAPQPAKPVHVEPVNSSAEQITQVKSPVQKVVPKQPIEPPLPQVSETEETIDMQKPSSKPSPAEILMGTADESSGKAAGRDYLVELLKK